MNESNSNMWRKVWKWGAVWLLSGCLVACQSPEVKVQPMQGLTAQQLQVLRSHGFEDGEGGWTLEVPTKLLFAVDTDQLNTQQVDYVAQLARDLYQVGIHSVRVEGHTDDTGSALYNQQLSERRAQRVADGLVRGGMQASQISTRGWGNTKPLPMVAGQGARRENRRVAIIIPGTTAP